MLYGFENDDVIYIGAADDYQEYDDLANRLDEDGVVYDRVGILEMMSSFEGFALPPITIRYDGACPIVYETRGPIALKDLERKMLSAYEKKQNIERNKDVYKEHDERRKLAPTDPNRFEDEAKRYTIAESLGIDKVDPWDMRTDEQKEKVKKVKKLIDTAKKDDNLTNDSFGGDSKAKVRGINGRLVNGQIVIDDVLAVKGFFDDGEEEQVVEINPDYFIAEPDYVSVYFRLNVYSNDCETVSAILEKNYFRLPRIYVQRNVGSDCWFVFVKKDWADDALEILVKEGLSAEVVGVNCYGEPLVEDNLVEVLDGRGVTKIRPWTDKRDLYVDTMKEKISGKEFYYYIHERGQNSTVYVVPVTWFDEHGSMFDEMLPIGHLFPKNTLQEAPGVFRNDEQRYSTMILMMDKMKMGESLLFDMFVRNHIIG